jgi:nitrate/TMAO reductase-like tetraheme cytochrome c subunit
MMLCGCESEPRESARPALSREQLLDPETCKDCHPKQYTEWSASMHAYASKDPVFLAMNKRGQEDPNAALGEFCVNCHMPMAVREKKIASLADLESVPHELQGVTCYFCHNAESFGTDHNNANITLANDNIMRAAIDKAQIPSVHRVRYSDNHDSNSPNSSLMCGTCHDIVNNHGVHLERTLAEYQTTVVSEPNTSRFQSCQDCHMPRAAEQMLAAKMSGYPGVGTTLRTVTEHFFPAVDVPLTDFPGAAAMRSAVEHCALADSISFFNVELTSPLGPFKVSIETSAGHGQPSGATQDRRMWLEVDGFDDQGKQLFSDGAIADGQIEETPGGVRHVCMFREHVYDAAGKEVHMFWEAEKAELLPKLIPAPISTEAGTHSAACEFGPILGRPLARLDFRLRMRPIGLDVLQDLVNTKHLSPDVMARMPTLTVDTRTARYVNGTYKVDKTTTRDCRTYHDMLAAMQAALEATTAAGAAGAQSAGGGGGS